ncbi:MAG: preprotein translocase subunit SecE [Planctomycetota bacterium]|nr:MAG: preprotein translocase subunit SecE [Planctomycetota bacterium]
MFKIYKSGQGKVVRLTVAFLFQALIIYGCYQFYLWMEFTDLKGNPLWIARPISYLEGLDMDLTPRLLIALGSFVLLTVLNYALANYPKFADFLIDVHIEMTKVTWPDKEEILKSTSVVLMVTIILMIWIALIDYFFSGLIKLVL